jgi:hypothetical protein
MQLQIDTGPALARRARTQKASTLGNQLVDGSDIACPRKQVDGERADGA